MLDIKASVVYDLMMRTTLTLDEDVGKELERVCREKNEKFRTVVNEALRAGLLTLDRKPDSKRTRYRTLPVSLGKARLPDLDNIAEVLGVVEGDHHR